LLSKNIKVNMYRTIVLPVVSYGCKTCSATLREERKLGVFENRVLRGIFGPKRDEVTGKWRRLLVKELHDLYSSLNIIRVIKSRRMRWAEHVARTRDRRSVYRVWWGDRRERYYMGDLGVNGRIKLKLVIRKWDGVHGRE
jgi:hypothetical protein